MNRTQTIEKRKKIYRIREKIEKALGDKPSLRRWSQLRYIQDTLRHINVHLELKLISSTDFPHPDSNPKYLRNITR